MSDFDLDHVPKKLIMVTVCVIVLAAFAIPTILQFAYGPGPHPGDEQDYYATANIPGAEFTFSGSAMTYATLTEGNHVHFKWTDSGHYDLIVTATTHQPDQTASKTVGYDINGDWQYTALFLVIPTLMIVAVMMFVIKPIRENIRMKKGGSGGDGDISGGLNRPRNLFRGHQCPRHQFSKHRYI